MSLLFQKFPLPYSYVWLGDQYKWLYNQCNYFDSNDHNCCHSVESVLTSSVRFFSSSSRFKFISVKWIAARDLFYCGYELYGYNCYNLLLLQFLLQQSSFLAYYFCSSRFSDHARGSLECIPKMQIRFASSSWYHSLCNMFLLELKLICFFFFLSLNLRMDATLPSNEGNNFPN